MTNQHDNTKALESIHNDMWLLAGTIHLLKFAVANDDDVTINSMDSYLCNLEIIGSRILERLGDL